MTKMRVRTTLGVALAGMAAVLGLLVSPAGAQNTSAPGASGGARATNDSVASGTCVAVSASTCSGSGSAVDDSVSSGSAVARDGSTASGCATAINDSTASGAPCPPVPTTVTHRPDRPSGPTARAATPTAARSLALTGSSSGELAGLALVALALGGVLVAVSSRRPLQS